MASTKDYLNYVLEQLSGLADVRYRAMMGEYVLYYRGKVVGGVYDDRLLLKPTPSARALLQDAPLELPYEGAKEMLVADVDDAESLRAVLTAMVDELPETKKKEGTVGKSSCTKWKRNRC